MTVFRDEHNGRYFVSFYLKDPSKPGKYKHITKRGFSTKKEAAKRPLIVMDALNTLGDMKVKDISNQDIIDSLRKLGVMN